MGKFTENENIRTFKELRYFTGLTSLDLHGDVNLEGEFDLTHHTKLVSVDLSGTKVSGVNIADGAILATIKYSPEIKNITLKSLAMLTEATAVGASKVVALDVENCPNVDSLALLKDVINSPLTSVTLIGVEGTEVADAADLIFNLIKSGCERNLQGQIVVQSVYNFMPDEINESDDVACIPSGQSSEKAFVIHYNWTKEPTIEEIGLVINEGAVEYNEGAIPEVVSSSVSANSTVFKNVDWSASDGEIDEQGNLTLDNSVAEDNQTKTDVAVVTATSKYNEQAKATRNVSVKRIGMSSITLEVEGTEPEKEGDTFTLQLVKDADTTKPYSHVEFEISDDSIVEMTAFDEVVGKATFSVISGETGEVTITAKNKFDEGVSDNLSWVLNDLIIINANRTDEQEMAANDRALMDVIYAQGWSSSPDKMTASEAKNVTSILSFEGNTSIKDLSCLKYFENTNSGSTTSFITKGLYPYCVFNMSNLKRIELPKSFSKTALFVGGCENLYKLTIPNNYTSLNALNAQGPVTAGLRRVVIENGGEPFIIEGGSRQLREFPFFEYLDVTDSCIRIGQFTVMNGIPRTWKLILRPINPPILDGLFQIYPSVIYVPAQSIDVYKSADVWSNFADKFVPIEGSGFEIQDLSIDY